jgi:hypothetical protein
VKNELLGTKETQSCPAALTTRAKRVGVSNDKKDKPRQLWESDRFIVAANKAQAPTVAKEATRGNRSTGNPIRKNGGVTWANLTGAPDKRVLAKSPVRAKLHAGICEGGTGQPVSLPRQPCARSFSDGDAGAEPPL